MQDDPSEASATIVKWEDRLAQARAEREKVLEERRRQGVAPPDPMAALRALAIAEGRVTDPAPPAVARPAKAPVADVPEAPRPAVTAVTAEPVSIARAAAPASAAAVEAPQPARRRGRSVAIAGVLGLGAGVAIGVALVAGFDGAPRTPPTAAAGHAPLLWSAVSPARDLAVVDDPGFGGALAGQPPRAPGAVPPLPAAALLAVPEASPALPTAPSTGPEIASVRAVPPAAPTQPQRLLPGSTPAVPLASTVAGPGATEARAVAPAGGAAPVEMGARPIAVAGPAAPSQPRTRPAGKTPQASAAPLPVSAGRAAGLESPRPLSGQPAPVPSPAVGSAPGTGPSARPETSAGPVPRRPADAAALVAAGAAAPVPVAASAAPAPSALPPAPAPAASREAQAAADLRALGLELEDWATPAFGVAATEVRYFHAADRARAEAAAADIGGAARDFSGYRPVPEPGRLDVRLKVPGGNGLVASAVVR